MSKDVICPKCGYDNLAGEKICGNCNEELPYSEEVVGAEEAIDNNSNIGSENKNSIGQALKTMGIISIILGILGGLIIASDISPISGVTTIFSSIIFGLVLLGFSEVIRLLQKISDK